MKLKLSFHDREIVRTAIAGMAYMCLDLSKTFRKGGSRERNGVMIDHGLPLVCEALGDAEMYGDVLQAMAAEINAATLPDIPKDGGRRDRELKRLSIAATAKMFIDFNRRDEALSYQARTGEILKHGLPDVCEKMGDRTLSSEVIEMIAGSMRVEAKADGRVEVSSK